MAGQTSRTVTLTLDAQTKGTDDVKTLAAEIRKLGASGGDAAPEFEQLARRLEQAGLAEQQQAKAAQTAAASLESAKKNLLDARAAVSAYTAAIGGAKKANAEQAAELERLNQAVLGSKASVDAARASVAAVTPEYNRMQAATRAAVLEAEKLKAAVTAPGDAAQASATKAEGAFSGLATKLRGLAGPIIAAFGAAEFWKVNTGIESLRRSLELLKGSSDAAAKEIEYLKTTSNRLGLDVQEVGKAYISLTAAAKGTALEGQATRTIFEAISGAMAKLGKSSADTEGALQAVAQMMSKGTVSMEEMRQQLGERLPGAMQAAADASGVTVGELTDMIGTGQVLASDLLPKLAEGLQKLYGTANQTDGLTSSWNRLKNAITDTFTFIGNAGVSAGIAAVLGQVAIAVRGLVGAFDLLGKSIGITLGALVTFDFKHPIDSVNAWREAIAKAAGDIQTNLDKANGAARDTAAGQKVLADSGKAVVTSANEQAVSWLAVVNAYAKVSKAAKETTDQAEKAAKATEAEGKAAIELANAFGTETEKRAAALTAANANATALKAVSDARRIEAEVAISNAAALTEAAKAEATLSEEKRKAIQAATDSATAKKSEADQAAAASLSAQQHAAVLEVETAALQDNSKRVDELRAAHLAAAEALEKVRAARLAGNASLVEEQAAAIDAGKAAAIYRDALNDQTAAIATNAQAKLSQMNVEQAGIRLQIEQQKGIAASARARGDEYTATQALLTIKELEIKLAELTAKAKAAEAEASLLVVKAKREELAAAGQLTAAKEAELKAQEAAAEVKKIEGQIARETAKQMKELFEATQLSASVAVLASEDYDKLADSINGVGNAASAAASQVSGLNSAGLSPSNRSHVAATGVVDTRGEALRQGATLDNVDEIVRQANFELERLMANGEGPKTLDRGVLTDIVRNALQTTNAQSTNTTRNAAPQSAPQTGGAVVNVNIGGKTTPVRVATGQDANQLTGIFKLLETDFLRA